LTKALILAAIRLTIAHVRRQESSMKTIPRNYKRSSY
jgi:hypothetical protein